jgi:predicted nucleotidyltransferase component of viral defense system
LLNLSRSRREDFNLILTHYALERLLYRLAGSEYAQRFVLKGALLFVIWTGRLHRPTRDLDLLGYGDSSAERLTQLFKRICVVSVEADGLAFDPDSVQVSEIRETHEYGGQRVHLVATLGRARIPLQIDIGFGDVVVPPAEEVEYPTLLKLPAPQLLVYPKEAVIAEKLQAMVALGILNSCMKDFYDVWMMARIFPFDGRRLCQAIRSTFEQRRTEIPQATPVALTAEFAQLLDKVTQWKAFLGRNRLDAGDIEFVQVIDELGNFLLPPLSAIASRQDLTVTWPARGPWSAS